MNVAKSLKLAAIEGRRWLIKRSPDVLTGINIGLSIVAVGLTIPATTKAEKLVSAKRAELQMKASAKGEVFEGIPPIEVIKTCWTCYVPTLLALGTSITSSIFANRISASRIAALATAYSISEKSFRDYRDEVKEMLGEDKEKRIKDGIAKKYNEEHPINPQNVERTGFGEYLVRDLETGRDFRSTQERVYQAFKRISDNLISETSQCVNDLYAELGLRESENGYLLGWHTADWPLEPQFSTTIADGGEPCLTISYPVHAIYDFRDY